MANAQPWYLDPRNSQARHATTHRYLKKKLLDPSAQVPAPASAAESVPAKPPQAAAGSAVESAAGPPSKGPMLDSSQVSGTPPTADPPPAPRPQPPRSPQPPRRPAALPPPRPTGHTPRAAQFEMPPAADKPPGGGGPAAPPLGGGGPAAAPFGMPGAGPSACTDSACPRCNAGGGKRCPVTGVAYTVVSKEAAETMAGLVGMLLTRLPYLVTGVDVPENERGIFAMQEEEAAGFTDALHTVMQRRMSQVGEWDDIIALTLAGAAVAGPRVMHAKQLEQRGFSRKPKPKKAAAPRPEERDE